MLLTCVVDALRKTSSDPADSLEPLGMLGRGSEMVGFSSSVHAFMIIIIAITIK